MIPDLVVRYSCAIHSQTAAPVDLEEHPVYGSVIALSTLSLIIMNVHCMCVFVASPWWIIHSHGYPILPMDMTNGHGSRYSWWSRHAHLVDFLKNLINYSTS